jgi:transposase
MDIVQNVTKIGKEELKKGKSLIVQGLIPVMLYPIENKELQTIRKRILKHNSELLTFLDLPEIEPTNNKAERALRPSVIFRKICFGNKSKQGVKNHQTLMSIINTAKLYGQKTLNILQTLTSPSLLPLPLPP